MYSAVALPSRRSREETDLVDHRRDLLAHGHADRLSGVLDLDGDKFVGARLDCISDAQERQRSLRRGGVPPFVERGAGRLHRAVDVLCARQWRRCVGLTGDRVDDVGRAAVVGID